MGAEEQTQNSAKQVDEQLEKISFWSPSRPCADVIVTLPNQHAPSFRALLPEFVTDLPHSRYFHTNPVDWKEQEGGSWSGTIEFKNFGKIVISLLPREYYVEITWTLENLSTSPLKKTVLDFCFNANNGGGSWANQEFLPSSRMNRKEDGKYWHDRVARKGTYVHSAGGWSQDPNAQLDASVLVIVNEAKDRYAFQMWNKPVVGTWVNRANACMHLKPVLCESLGVGEKAEIRGRMGISREGLEQVWHLYQSLQFAQTQTALFKEELSQLLHQQPRRGPLWARFLRAFTSLLNQPTVNRR